MSKNHRTPLVFKSFFVLVLAGLIAGVAWAETIELVTYYPTSSSSGNLNVTSLAVNYPGTTPATGTAIISGPVGIGTTNPLVDLEVYRADESYIRVWGTGINAAPENFSGLELGSDLPGDGVIDRIWQLAHKRGGAGGLNDFQIAYFDGAAWAPRLTIRPNGNVGIGTAAPQGVFHVVGANDAISNVLFTAGADTNGAAGTPPEIRVGIGTNAPGQTLSVEGTLGILEGGANPSDHTIFWGSTQTGDIAYFLPAAQGAAGAVLSNAGNGVLSWVGGGAFQTPSLSSLLQGIGRLPLE